MFFVMPLSSVGIKAKVGNRVVAKVIDLVLVVTVAVMLPYPLGPLLGFLYSLVADGLSFKPFQGQSVGKKIMRLKVINMITKKPASLRDSVLRNSPVGVATFFAIIPVWGWLILGIVGIPLMVMEVYLMLSVESGHRLGDVMGDTEVIELKNASAKNVVSN
ncbi:MAG: RDD family protein [Bdellovibrionota bacterium]